MSLFVRENDMIEVDSTQTYFREEVIKEAIEIVTKYPQLKLNMLDAIDFLYMDEIPDTRDWDEFIAKALRINWDEHYVWLKKYLEEDWVMIMFIYSGSELWHTKHWKEHGHIYIDDIYRLLHSMGASGLDDMYRATGANYSYAYDYFKNDKAIMVEGETDMHGLPLYYYETEDLRNERG